MTLRTYTMLLTSVFCSSAALASLSVQQYLLPQTISHASPVAVTAGTAASVVATPVSTSAPYTVQIPANQYAVLAFHDVRDDVLPEIDHDPFAISTARLASFFDWIARHDLHPVSLKTILAAQKGQVTLPKNAVLLTFDDGPESNFTHLFPLLRSYHYPALLALQTGWINGDVKIDLYGKGGFVTWRQLQEMQASGLVEFASHSHDLHKGIPANPGGNLEPAAITRRYDAVSKRYESEADYVKRIHDDLQKSAQLIHQHLGVSPQVMVWPYGAMNEQTREIAKSVGMPISYSLGDEKINNLTSANQPVARMLVGGSPSPVELEQQIDAVLNPQDKIQRAVEISLDQVYDPDPAQVERKLSALLEQVKAYSIRSVYLKAYAEPTAKGMVSAVYFPNRHLPLRADLFNRVAWQLRTRTDVKVYAVMPLLDYTVPNAVPNAAPNAVQSRLDPALPAAAALVGDLFEDLGKNAPGINGILLDSEVGSDPTLTAFADRAVSRLTRYRDSSNDFYIARRVVIQSEGSADGSQVATMLAPLIQHYDEVVLQLAAPVESEQRLRALVAQVAALPRGLAKVTFALSATSAQPPSSRALAAQMRTLISAGAKNIAYTPNDFMHNSPDFSVIYPVFSLNSFPELYKVPEPTRAPVRISADPSLQTDPRGVLIPGVGVSP